MLEGARRAASDAASIVAEPLWRATARVVGRAFSLRATAVDRCERVLVVAPHPDDETVGCGGTIAAHVALGDIVEVLVVTDGRGSKALGRSPDETAAVRALEVEAAVGALGAGLTMLAQHDLAIDDEALEACLRERIATQRPKRIYAPSCVDLHPDHLRTAAAVARANAAAEVFAYQTYLPLTPVLATHAHDVGAHARAVDAAYAAHASQAAAIERFRRLRRYDAALTGAEAIAELFVAFDAATYARLHASPSPADWRAPRRTAVLDPLTYLRGHHARRSLRAAAAAVDA